MICLIVEISVAPDAVDQLADDSDRVYAEIFKTVPGFLFGTLGIRRGERDALAVVYFENSEAFEAARPVIEGVREAMGVSPGATFTLTAYEIVASGVGLEPSRLFSRSGETAAPGAPG